MPWIWTQSEMRLFVILWLLLKYTDGTIYVNNFIAPIFTGKKILKNVARTAVEKIEKISSPHKKTRKSITIKTRGKKKDPNINKDDDTLRNSKLQSNVLLNVISSFGT